jgi:hypothetical protein
MEWVFAEFDTICGNYHNRDVRESDELPGKPTQWIGDGIGTDNDHRVALSTCAGEDRRGYFGIVLRGIPLTGMSLGQEREAPKPDVSRKISGDFIDFVLYARCGKQSAVVIELCGQFDNDQVRVRPFRERTRGSQDPFIHGAGMRCGNCNGK